MAMLPTESATEAQIPGPMSLFSSPIITLVVGPNEFKFHVHEQILAASSTYWRDRVSELEPPPQAKHNKYFPVWRSSFLPREDPFVVGYFLEFIYAKRPEYTIPAENDEMLVHIELYYFGEKYGVPKLQEFSLQKIWEWLVYDDDFFNKWQENLVPTRIAIVRKAYEHTIYDRSGLRKLLTSDFARRWDAYRAQAWNGDDIDENSELGKLLDASPMFARDLLLCVGNSSEAPTRPPSPTAWGLRELTESFTESEGESEGVLDGGFSVGW